MGVGRDNMSKLFVDDIRDKGRKNLISPSPDAYSNTENTFGKVGLKYTMGGNRDRSGLKYDNRHNYYLNMEGKQPGPASYKAQEVTGKAPIDSNMKSSRSPSFSKATDRFSSIHERRLSPGPTQYSPKMSLGAEVSSTLQRAPRARIG